MAFSVPVVVAGAAMVLVGAGAFWWQQRPIFPPAVVGPVPTAVGPSGPLQVSTLAGQPSGLTYRDGPAATARFSRIGSMARDGHGNLYVAGSSEIRKISPEGQVSTVAGAPAGETIIDDGSSITYGDYNPSVDGQGPAARLLVPTNLVAAPDGTLFFLENNAIRRVSPRGEVTTWAGSLKNPFDDGSHRDGPRAQALFNRPQGLVLDAQGNLLVADQRNHVIRRISSAGQVSTLAGQPGQEGYTDGAGPAALFNAPTHLALLPDGSLLVNDSGNNCLRRVSRQGQVSTWAGTATNTPRRNGPGAELKLSVIQGLAVGPDGAVYFTDSDHRHVIRRILPDRTEPVRPWAGEQNARAYADAPTPAAARFNFPVDLLLAANGTLYVADTQNGVVRSIAPTGVVRTVAGEAPRRTVDGFGALAAFAGPSGLTIDGAGHVLVADRSHHLIRRVSPRGDVTTVAGRPLVGGETFDASQGTGFYNPATVALGPNGTIYVADEGRHVIQKISAEGKLSIWAGRPGDSGTNDGPPGRGRLNYPVSLVVAADGSAYCTDRESRAVRRIAPDGRISTIEKGRSLYVSCKVPESHGVYLSRANQANLWNRFYTQAPALLPPCAAPCKRARPAPPRWPASTG